MNEVLVILSLYGLWMAFAALLIYYAIDPLVCRAIWWLMGLIYGREIA